MKFIKIIIRASLLLLIITLGFTAIFPGWYDNRKIIYNEISHRFMPNEEIILREKAARAGIPYKEYKQKITAEAQAKALLAKLNLDLDNALAVNDPELIKVAVNNFSSEQISSKQLISVIKNGNLIAFTGLYKKSPSCHVEKQLKSVDIAKLKKVKHDVNLFEKTTYRALLDSDHDELLRAWYEMGCGQVVASQVNEKSNDEFLNGLVKDLVIRKTPNKVLALKGLDEFEYLSTQVIWQSLKKGWDETAQSLFEGIYENDDLTLHAINFADVKHDSGAKDDMVLYALRHEHLLFAKSVLDYDLDYIKRNNLSAEVYKTIVAKPFPFRATVQLLSDGLLDLEATKIDTKAALLSSVEAGVFETVVLLLKHDTTITLENLTVKSWGKFDRSIRHKSLEMFSFLLERGLDFDEFDYKGVDQLSNAMLQGDEALVQFLLVTAGINPAIEFRGKTILDNEIGGDTDTQARIKALLTQHGAHDDYFRLVRDRTGVEENLNCSVGQQLGEHSYASEELIDFFGRAFESKEKITKINICEAALIGCTGKNGHSIDDCLGGTIPVCVNDNSINVSTMKPADICCPSDIKETYVEAKCSGLDTINAAITLRGKGFTEAYTIPRFLTHTKEYQDFSKAKEGAKK